MKTKFNAYEKTLDEFINTIQVVCPKCQEKAQVVYTQENKAVLTCVSCAFNSSKKVTLYNLGLNKDPFFNHALWFQKNLKDGILWAYNIEHLRFLENHISSELRERDSSKNRNQSIGSRLPKWISSKKNRNEILKAIQQLKKL